MLLLHLSQKNLDEDSECVLAHFDELLRQAPDFSLLVLVHLLKLDVGVEVLHLIPVYEQHVEVLLALLSAQVALKVFKQVQSPDVAQLQDVDQVVLDLVLQDLQRQLRRSQGFQHSAAICVPLRKSTRHKGSL